VLPSGAVAGLVIGLALAFLADRRDKRIRGAHDVERVLGLPAMLTVPATSSGQLVSSASPGSSQPVIELAHAVAAELGRGDHVVLVAGVSPGPAGGMVAADLAAGLARTHASTLLVCAHSDSAVPQALLGAAGGRGLSDVLAGVASLEEVIHETAVPGLTVITPGTHRSFTAASRTLAAADKLMAQLRASAQYIVIDVQATQEGAGTFTLAQFADGALIVVQERRTTHDEAIETIRRLRLLGTHVLGVVLSSARRRRRARGRATRQRQPWLESAPKPAEDYPLPAYHGAASPAGNGTASPAGNGTASPAGNGSLRAAGSDDATVVLGARPLSATSATQVGAERPAPLRAERDDLPDTAHGS